MNEVHRMTPGPGDADQLVADGGQLLSGASFDSGRMETRDQLLVEQARLLELVARGRDLATCLTEITATVGQLLPGARAAILVADPDRTSIEVAYSAEVPDSFGDKIKGARIEEFAIGTCGTAIFKSQPVVCTDVDSDDRWGPNGVSCARRTGCLPAIRSR